MIKGKILNILKAPEDWEIIQNTDGFADIDIEISISDNINDDTENEIDFSQDSIYARIVNEESGEYITPLINLKGNGQIFKCSLCKVPCGGPYLLDFVLFDRQKNIECPMVGNRRRHFYVGDIYIIAGQSNAAGMGKGFLTEEAEMGVHILRNLKYWDIASQPFNDFDYSKQSMFLAFAKKIKKQTGIPVGLIPSAMGGSPLSRWLKDENGDLYKKMIDTLKSRGIKAKALLWHQGCSDVWGISGNLEYIGRFRKFTEDLRKDLENQDLPIFTFQLNRQQIKDKAAEDDFAYDCLREAQRRAAAEIKNVHILPTIDALNMSDFIHNSKSSNIMLGERLACQVLKEIYGVGGGISVPQILKAYFVSDNELKLEFSNVCEFLYAFESSIGDFPIKIEDERGILDIADYKIAADTITLITARKPYGNVFVSGQSGSNPQNIIIDYGTQIPMLCFSRFKVGKGE